MYLYIQKTLQTDFNKYKNYKASTTEDTCDEPHRPDCTLQIGFFHPNSQVYLFQTGLQ